MRVRIARRTATAAAVLCMLSWLPTTQANAAPARPAATMVATVADAQSLEHELECGFAPGPCNIRYARRLLFRVSVSNFSGSPITFGFRAEDITTTSGVDYVPWPYAPPDRVTTDAYGYAYIALDVVIDSVAEPSETVRIRLTSTSRPADISDTAIGTVLDGNQLPPDCSAARIDNDRGSVTCSNRPAGQNWQGRFECGGFPPPWVRGNVVAGNGTSTGNCGITGESWGGSMAFALVP